MIESEIDRKPILLHVANHQTLFDPTLSEDLIINIAPSIECKFFSILGVGQVRQRIQFKLHQHAVLRIVTVVIGNGDDRFELDYLIHHIGRSSSSNTLVKCVLTDAAKADIVGLIKIDPTGQQVESFLEQRALLLSKHARANIKPMLEIEANEVRASHAATISQLDAEQLFYCQSRGISQATAIRLMVRSFLNEAVTMFPDKNRDASWYIAYEKKLSQLTSIEDGIRIEN